MFSFKALSLLMCILGVLAQDHIVHPNIGVILHKVKEITIDPMIWHHTIAIPLFQNVSLGSPIMRCQNQSPSDDCFEVEDAFVSEILDLYDALRYNIVSDLIERQNTKDIISLNSNEQRNRQKRGWFDIIGKAAKKVIGVATQQDLQILNNHMQKLAILVKEQSNSRKFESENLHSFEVQMAHRINNTIAHVSYLEDFVKQGFESTKRLKYLLMNKLKIPERVSEIESFLEKSNRVNVLLHQYDIHIEGLEQVHRKTEAITIAMDQLLQGRLDANIISPSELHDILSSVDSKLQSQSSSKSVSTDVKSYYKHNHLTTCTHDGKSLFIKLKIPIGSESTTFDLYELEAVPVPTDHSNRSSVYTLVSGFSKYLAVSKDSSLYLELSENELFSLKMNNYQYIPTPVSEPSCTYFLFEGNVEGILNFCTNLVLEDLSIFREFIYQMETGEVLLYTPNIEWTLICNKTETVDKVYSKGLFKFHVACNCFLKYDVLEIYAYDSDCMTTRSESKLWYSANMLAYHVLYKDKISLDLSSISFTEEPYNFEFPNISMIDRESAKFAEMDAQYAIKLSTLLNQWNQSSSDQDWSFFMWDETVFKSTVGIGSVVLVSIEIICVCALTYVFYQLENLKKSLILIATCIHASEALDFTLPPPPAADVSLQTNCINEDFWKTVVILLSLVLAIYSIIQQWVDKCIKQTGQERFNVVNKLRTELFLCFFDKKSHLLVKVCTIPGAMDDISFHNLEKLRKISFKLSCLLPRLFIDWNQVKLKVNNIENTNLPKQYRFTNLQQLNSWPDIAKLLRLSSWQDSGSKRFPPFRFAYFLEVTL
jgi:hypothetical protein